MDSPDGALSAPSCRAPRRDTNGHRASTVPNTGAAPSDGCSPRRVRSGPRSARSTVRACLGHARDGPRRALGSQPRARPTIGSTEPTRSRAIWRRRGRHWLRSRGLGGTARGVLTGSDSEPPRRKRIATVGVSTIGCASSSRGPPRPARTTRRNRPRVVELTPHTQRRCRCVRKEFAIPVHQIGLERSTRDERVGIVELLLVPACRDEVMLVQRGLHRLEPTVVHDVVCVAEQDDFTASCLDTGVAGPARTRWPLGSGTTTMGRRPVNPSITWRVSSVEPSSTTTISHSPRTLCRASASSW